MLYLKKGKKTQNPLRIPEVIFQLFYFLKKYFFSDSEIQIGSAVILTPVLQAALTLHLLSTLGKMSMLPLQFKQAQWGFMYF